MNFKDLKSFHLESKYGCQIALLKSLNFLLLLENTNLLFELLNMYLISLQVLFTSLRHGDHHGQTKVFQIELIEVLICRQLYYFYLYFLFDLTFI